MVEGEVGEIWLGGTRGLEEEKEGKKKRKKFKISLFGFGEF